MTKKEFYELEPNERDILLRKEYGNEVIDFANNFRVDDYKKGEMYVITGKNGKQEICTIDYKRKNSIRFHYDGGWFYLHLGKEDSWESFIWKQPVKMQRVYGDMPDKFFNFLHKRYNVSMQSHVHGVN